MFVRLFRTPICLRNEVKEVVGVVVSSEVKQNQDGKWEGRVFVDYALRKQTLRIYEAFPLTDQASRDHFRWYWGRGTLHMASRLHCGLDDRYIPYITKSIASAIVSILFNQ